MSTSNRIDISKKVIAMNTAAFRVLEIMEQEKKPISGEEISRALGISRSAVWKHINELKSMGYEISSSRSEGYSLDSRTSQLLPYELNKNLKTRFIGKNAEYFTSTASTTWVAKELCTRKNPADLNGTIIIAEEQTGGVGRLGRAWVSPQGGIWFTLILTPTIPLENLFMITMAGSIAIVRAIKKEYGLGALIKWPNDIYLGDKKVGGLLLELSAEADTVYYCLLGIGIDANISTDKLPPELQRTTTSLNAEYGGDIDRVKLLARTLKELEQRYLLLESEEYGTIVREWKSLSMTLDHRVQIKTPKKSFEGEAIDIVEHGALIIRKDNGKIERVIAGDCYQM
jgi:BirA family biotin operon repressor/biotin-[acetyl-CoA-carboxylase] ligase